MCTTDVSIIIPIYNGAKWIDSCFESIISQTALNTLKIDICVCNDASTDETGDILKKWEGFFREQNVDLKVFKNSAESPKGVGYGKNQAINLSCGEYLCFQDIDDLMFPNRILSQHNKAKCLDNNYIIGTNFERVPKDSTLRYTKWANSLTEKELSLQIYTSHGPTVIMPTWFCHRDVFLKIGGFSQTGKGTPEDMIFFYQHLNNGGKLAKVDEVLLIYTYHEGATTFSIDEQTIWNLRIDRLQTRVLTKWNNFTIWNAGKQGRKFYNSLQPEFQMKVLGMCDVDVKKIKARYYIPYSNRKTGRPLTITHFTEAVSPFVICVKMDMTNGEFESNLRSLNLTEGEDFVYFC